MIKIENLSKKYDQKTVFENFNLQVEQGKILVILGESGSGKTTLINVLANLTEYQGKVVGGLEPISMVFQENRLAENLTVRENLTLVGAEEIDEILKEVGLSSVADDYPKSFSAGMARRVAVARAIAYPHKTLLMDEALINLDVALKYSLMELIKRKQKEKESTVVFVTHDVKEAVYMADRIVVLKDGKIVYDNDQIKKETENELFGLMLKIGQDKL